MKKNIQRFHLNPLAGPDDPDILELKEKKSVPIENNDELVLMFVSADQVVNISKIKEFIKEDKNLDGKSILIKHGNKYILYAYTAQGEWQLIKGLNAIKFAGLDFGDRLEIISNKEQNEIMVMKLSLLIARKDDISKEIKQNPTDGFLAEKLKSISKKIEKIEKIQAELAINFKSKGIYSPNNKENLILIDTKADGDCALHAILGQLNKSTMQIECANTTVKRNLISTAIRECKENNGLLHVLIVAGVRELIMSGQTLGKFCRNLKADYQEFLVDQRDISPILWQKFEAILCQDEYKDIIHYIHKHTPKNEPSLRKKFYDALNAESGTLYGLIMSFNSLNEAFQEYNNLYNTEYDWNAKILDEKGIKNEYADFVAKERSWLLPSELAIIAHAFHISVNYYPSTNSSVLVLNPGELSTVIVQFNDVNHFERLEFKNYKKVNILSREEVPEIVYKEISSKKGSIPEKKPSLDVSSMTTPMSASLSFASSDRSPIDLNIDSKATSVLVNPLTESKLSKPASKNILSELKVIKGLVRLEDKLELIPKPKTTYNSNSLDEKEPSWQTFAGKGAGISDDENLMREDLGTSMTKGSFTEKYLFDGFKRFNDSCAIIQYDLDNNNSTLTFTYQDLLNGALNLANILSTKYPQLSRGSIIAVAADQYSTYVVSLLAIWQLRCVYLPLNSSDIEGSIKRLELSQAKILIADEKYLKNKKVITKTKNISSIKWKDFQPEIHTSIEIKENKNTDIKRDYQETETAYIYTSSGTTDMPKMIQNDFTGLINRVDAAANLLKLKHRSGILAYSGMDFDASLFDILMAFRTGACLYPISLRVRMEILPIEKIFFYAAKTLYPITTMVVVPHVLKILFEEYSKEEKLASFKSLKTMITMGEKCDTECLANWFKNIDSLEILNGYGTTETNIAATITPLKKTDFTTPQDDGKNILPIQDFLPGVELFYLRETKKNDFFQIFDAKTIIKSGLTEGNIELVIGGEGVGRYFEPDQNNYPEEFKRMKELNQKNFINRKKLLDKKKFKILFEEDSKYPNKKRWYRTGDMVKIHKKTNENDTSVNFQYSLEFKTRKNNSIKRNGVFIYFDQVEKYLTKKCKKLIEKVIITKVNDNDNKFSAFLIPNGNKKFESDEVFEKKLFKEFNKNNGSSITDRRLYPSYFFLLKKEFKQTCNSNQKKVETFQELLKISERWLIPRKKNKSPEYSFNEIEKKVVDIWKSILFDDLEKFAEFKKLSKDTDAEHIFNKNDNFYNLGGDSVSLMRMLYKLWPNQNFPIEVLKNPQLDLIIRYYKISETFKIFPIEHLKKLGYPLIYLNRSESKDDFKEEFKKIFDETAFCQINIHDNLKMDENDIAKAIQHQIIDHYPIGPYILLITNDDTHNLMDQVANKLQYTDLVDKVLMTHEMKSEDLKRKIKEVRLKLIRRSCIKKIKKWNKLDGFRESSNVCVIPTKDTWYQCAGHSGRTTSLKVWCKQLLNKSEILPIYFDLQGYHQKNVIEILFNQIGFNTLEFEYLKGQKIVLLLDHYDRMNRHDIFNFKELNSFLNSQNVTIIVSSRYLQLENLLKIYKNNPYELLSEIDQAHNNILESFTIKTLAKRNLLLKQTIRDIYESKDINLFFKNYINIEKQHHPHLRDININPKTFIIFLRQFLKLDINEINHICIEKSPSESLFPNYKKFMRADPYFIIIRGLLSYTKKTRSYSFPNQLIKFFGDNQPLFIQSPALYLPKTVSHENIKPLSLEDLLLLEPAPVCRFKSDNPRKPIVVFYPLTGDISQHYYQLFEKIGTHQPWLGFAMNLDKFKGIKNKMMDAMADYYTGILASLPNEMFQPFILLGWSFGALLAFSVAEKLEKLNLIVDLVINIDCPPPCYLKKIWRIKRVKLIVDILATQNGYELSEKEKIKIKKCLVNVGPKSSIDHLLLKVNETLHEDPEEDSERRINRFTQALERSKINISACASFNSKRVNSRLMVIEAKQKIEGLNKNAKYGKWEKYRSDNKLIHEKFEDNDHFDIFKSKLLANAIRKQIDFFRPLINITNIEEHLDQYYRLIPHNKNEFYDFDGLKDQKESKRESLLTLCKEHIKNKDHHPLLIYGPAGSGKTVLLLELARLIIDKDLESKDLFSKGITEIRVFYIKVHDHIGLISSLLKDYGFDADQFKKPDSTISIVLLLDGFENLSDKTNLWKENELKDWQHIKLIISCRDEALDSDTSRWSELFADEKGHYHKIACLPLTEKQITNFFAKSLDNTDFNFIKEYPYENKEPPFESKITLSSHDEIAEQLRIRFAREFGELIKRPLILALLVKIIKHHQPIHFNNHSCYQLYQEFFTQQLVSARKNIDNQSGVYIGTNFFKEIWNYAMRIAKELSNGQQCYETKNYLTPQAHMSLAGILNFEGQNINFSHDSFRDFFYGTYLWKILNKLDIAEEIINDPWHQQPLYNQTLLLSFVVEQLNLLGNTERLKLISKLTDQLKNKSIGKYFPRNLITFLVLGGVVFNEIHFSELSFENADLTNAQFENCIFHNIKFTNTVIHSALFHNCKFIECSFANARINSPYLISPQVIQSMCISHDFNLLAFLTLSFSLQKIEIYNLKQDKIINSFEPGDKNTFCESIDFDTDGNLNILSVRRLNNKQIDKYGDNGKLFRFYPDSRKLIMLKFNRSNKERTEKDLSNWSYFKIPELGAKARHFLIFNLIYSVDNINTIETINSLPGANFSAISGDGNFYAINTEICPKEILIYKVNDLNQIYKKLYLFNSKIYEYSSIIILGFTFNENGSLLAVACHDFITIFQIETAHPVIVIPVKLHPYLTFGKFPIIFSNNNLLLAGTSNGVSVWDIGNYIQANSSTHSLPPLYMAFTVYSQKDCSPQLYVGDTSGRILRLDINSGKVLNILLTLEETIIYHLAIDDKNEYLAIVADHVQSNFHKKIDTMNTIIIFNLNTNEIQYKNDKLLPVRHSIYFDKNEYLVVDQKSSFKICKKSNIIELEKLDKTKDKFFPSKIPLEQLSVNKSKLFFKPTDWQYSKPYIFFLSSHLQIIAYKLDNLGKLNLLWISGIIANNFHNSSYSGDLKNCDPKNYKILQNSAIKFIIEDLKILSITNTKKNVSNSEDSVYNEELFSQESHNEITGNIFNPTAK